MTPRTEDITLAAWVLYGLEADVALYAPSYCCYAAINSSKAVWRASERAYERLHREQGLDDGCLLDYPQLFKSIKLAHQPGIKYETLSGDGMVYVLRALSEDGPQGPDREDEIRNCGYAFIPKGVANRIAQRVWLPERQGERD